MGFRRVTVVGMLQSGKTTLLTALIDHWLNHDKSRMPLRNGKEILCRWKDLHSSGAQEFQRARHAFTAGRWPKKTLVPMSYSLKWKFAGDYFEQEIELIDIPGERLADADMILCKDLKQWSLHMVHIFENDALTQRPFSKFCKLFKEARAQNEHIVWMSELEKAYREFIATLITHQHPLVTPSSMLIDHLGNNVPKDVCGDLDKLIDWLVHAAPLGLGDRRLFPLPEPLLKTPKGVEMQSTYRGYLRQVVWPSLLPLSNSNDVIVVTDVAGILEGGLAWKNTISHLYAQIERFLNPGSLLWRVTKETGRWVCYLGTFGLSAPRGMGRVFVIASQADRVHKEYQDALVNLADELASHAFRRIRGANVSVEVLAVSAVTSTVSKEDGIIQYRQRKENALSEVEAEAQRLPHFFEDDWAKGKYRFPRCQPTMPANKTKPSKQFGLDQLTIQLLQD